MDVVSTLLSVLIYVKGWHWRLQIVDIHFQETSYFHKAHIMAAHDVRGQIIWRHGFDLV